MRIDDIIYFSRKYKTSYLEFEKGEELLKALIDRVEEFYFIPADKLDGEFEAFAKGVLILTAIDFIGELFIGTANSHRIKEFCKGLKSLKDKEVAEVNRIVEIINENYRNGLVHEGRIKNLGQFSYDFPDLIIIGDSYSMINPEVLLKETRLRFYDYVNLIIRSKEDMYQFKKKFNSLFKSEVDLLPN